MRRGLITTGGLLAAAAATVTGGMLLPAPRPAELAPPASRVQLPTTGVAAVPVCPGPETLVAAAGGSAHALAGPVTAAAVVEGGGASLGGTPVTTGPAGLGLLALPRTTAGTVALTAAAAPSASPAPRMAAAQGALARTGDLRGLSAVACSPAAAQTWLIGGGTQPGRRGRLVLTNPTASPAVVDVTVLGPAGPVDAPSGKGVVVAAGRQTALLIDALAPGLPAVAVDVRARSGRVAATLHDTVVRGLTPGGVSEVTASAAASRRQLVPGLSIAGTSGTPGNAFTPGATALRLANPGATPAVVRLRLFGDRGPVTPGTAVATVEPRSVGDVVIVDVPPGTYTAVVEADVPVLAAGLSGRTLDGGPLAGTPAGVGRSVPPADLAWSPSVDPLSGAALAVLPALTEKGRPVAVGAVLSVAATQGPVTVDVDEIDAGGRVVRTSPVAVDAEHAHDLALASSTAAVRLTPRAGTGAVAAVVEQVQDPAGPMLAVLAVRSGPVGSGARPSVVPDPRTGLRP